VTLADAAARARIRSDLEQTFVVEAAAGTGKTSELVRRIVAVLAAGRGSVESLVAVTFTEKAAGELKLRLRAALERARQEAAAGGEERQRLEEALARMEDARVGTIHGFCADLLRERPVEGRVDPRFRVTTEAEARRLFGAEFRRWLQRVLDDPPEGVRRAMRRLAFAPGGASARLEQAAWTLAEWRDFRALWRRDPFDRVAQLDRGVAELLAFADLSARCSSPNSDFLHRDTEPARRLALEIRENEGVRGRDHDGLEAALVALAGNRNFRNAGPGRGKWYGRGLAREDVQSAHARLLVALDDFARRADADLAPLLQRELSEVVDLYERRKQRAGCVDFLDLLLRARDLIRDGHAVRAELQRRFTHLFVDEFQDTDPLQAEILLLLAARDPACTDWRAVELVPGKLFLVGDPKQSIYRFRRADVGIYLRVRDLLTAGGAECLQLSVSFRAVPELQAVVNAGFAPVMAGDAKVLQADYVPLSPHREGAAQQPAVVVLPVPRPLGRRGRVTQTAIEESLPDAAGAFVDWLLHESGWTVTERENPTLRVPVSARHVCLLFRRFDSAFKQGGDVARDYVQALEARGIPHLLVGGGSFHAREEVEALRSALCAIEWPEDELSVFATLHGSFFGFGDELLFEYRQVVGRLHPFRRPAELPERLARIGEALELLGDLHRRRNRRTVAETIALLLESTRAHAGLALRPSGEQALANVLHVAELARAYESSGGLSFRGFVQQLLEEAEGGKAAEAPIVEEGSEGVRLMTVHRAKGLEFPVVLLADLTCHLVRNVAGRWIAPAGDLCAVRLGGWSPAELLEHEQEEVARDRAEALRVAYVAATRARDLLVVPAVGVEPFEASWIGPLNGAIYPPRPDGRWQPPSSRAAAGCPAFGTSSLAVGVGLQDDGSDGSVAPGHYELAPGHAVTWFDPNLLRLDAKPRFGIRQEELIGRDADPAVVAADLRRHEEWLAARAAALAQGARPSLVALTATAYAQATTAAAEVRWHETPRASDRPAGARFGALVHAVLAGIELDAPRDAIAATAELHARLLGATAEERSAAIAAVETALLDPLLQRARAADARGECRRETPLALRLDDGTVVDGVVDLAFLEDGRWTVIDFKTDREIAAPARAVYECQVSLYARAIGAATGQPAEAVLLRV